MSFEVLSGFENIARDKSIIVKDAYKRYSDIISMEGLNMSVSTGTMYILWLGVRMCILYTAISIDCDSTLKRYGLLGPSGCGKTTLLNCILGLTALDSGNIYLKAQCHSEISYMPQDITLHNNLTSYQTFIFYGKLYGINDGNVKRRINELVRLLRLPSLSIQIKNLSGGEKRRLSFGVALFHDPKIMILDEPTVGIDPVIRQSIWNHLVELSLRGKTIVITTHYVEEAVRADVVGFMRNGVLVGEDSPNTLILKQSSLTLEEAFLSLCCIQESEKTSITSKREYSAILPFTKNRLKNNFSWRRIRALTYKNAALLYKDHTFLFFTFVLPLVQTIVYNLCVGHNIQNVKLGVVNDEVNNCSTGLYQQKCFLNDPNNTKLSCMFIDHLRASNNYLIDYSTLESGNAALNAKLIWGLIYFTSNYTLTLKNRLNLFVNRYDIDFSSVQITLDSSNYIMKLKIKDDMTSTFVKTLNQAAMYCNISEKSYSYPISIQSIGNVKVTEFIHSASPGFIVLLAFYFPMILSTGLLLSEKDEGIMSRIMVAGVKFLEFVVSIIFLQTIVHIIQSSIEIFIMYFMFNNPISLDNFWTFAMTIMIIGYQGMFAGILVATVSKNYTMATHINMGTNVLFSCLCGLIWPMESAHPILKAFNCFLPLSIASETIGNLTLKEWPLYHPLVLRGLILTIVWLIVFAVPERIVKRYTILLKMAEIVNKKIQTESELAICILNAFKSFSDTCVLNGLNMSVPLGSIYGLLGPSGCGKTTLINVILGKFPLDSGIIKIHPSRYSDIGYMPQDLCLDSMLTIGETFKYYGSLYKMNKSDISSKSKELISWLKLPQSYTLLKDLRLKIYIEIRIEFGGECRRVSLAVTLLHDPTIIILDEPTVGIDPVLRYEIWQKLLEMVKTQAKTIIITTHYIEEAHQAHTIGLMRNGVLISETSPQNLLVQQNANSLEEAFLSLSSSQEFDETTQKVNISKNTNASSNILHSDNGISFIRIGAFIKKNVAICLRDFTFIFFMILFPMMAAIIFNLAIGGNIKNVNIAIQNKEIAECQTVVVNPCIYDEINNLTLSCAVLNGLQTLEYNLIPVKNQEEGDILVKKAKSVAFIQFPQNFSIGLQQYVLGSWFSTNEYSSNTAAYTNIDVGNVLVKSQIIRNLLNVFEDVIVNSTRACSEKIVKSPFRTTNLVGNKVETFIHSIATMFVSMIGFYFSSVISTGFMLTEKMEGFLDRSMTAGITILEVIKYSLTCLLIVGLSKSSSEAMNMVIGWNMMQIYLSGIMWPIEAQMPFMKIISEHLPLCYISRILNNIVLRGWTFTHPNVLIGIAIIIGYVFLHEGKIKYDIKVTNAFKKYGQNNIFNGLNMAVKSGSIYGLLGPSGCGKSTLLQCILGALPLDSGCIDLQVESLEDVGYMPQDLCLEVTLTIKETLEYYGSLYRMSKKHIKDKLDELNVFLQLPHFNSYLNEISGGQSRRVSFAISLLHDPKVMILDEPTVGIDPLLREGIWAEFTKMVKEHKKTIIITTHYIEEANKSDCVGLMRNGLIIEEGPPQDILVKYGTDTLEAAFLTLCCNQGRIIQKVNNSNIQVEEKNQPKKIMEMGNNFDVYRIKALIKKNYRVCSRDYLLLFTVILLPILQTFNFCFGIGVPFKDMQIAYKNDEINILDCQYSNVNTCIFEENSNQKMSCIIMNYLSSHDYKLIEVQDREVAEASIDHIEYIGFLYFPENYTSGLTKYINDRQYFDLESRLFAHLTNENILFKNQITLDVIQSINYIIKEALNSCSNNPTSISVPLEFNTLFGKEVKSLANGVINLFIAMVAFYFPSVFAVSIMMSEKMDGLLSRSMYAGLLTAVITTTKLGGVYIITGTSLTQFLLSGAVWPLEGQPQLLKKASKLLPIRLVGNTLNDIALKGWTLDHPSIISGTSLTVLYTILLVLVLILLGKLKKDLWVIKK
ncbi:ABC transporter G family member 23-like [Aphis craccivora]|uniref:ABC transporter G family member 23-like n=1 Tax=Aphis craccivora TaxID=307492 RepID=A0A6G0YWX3_APHCR|nr:ABC transporter G family member 23-like [Aphis craccivora]